MEFSGDGISENRAGETRRTQGKKNLATAISGVRSQFSSMLAPVPLRALDAIASELVMMRYERKKDEQWEIGRLL
jgi:hypothetical protein